MNAVTTAIGSRRFMRAFSWAAALVLIAGMVAFLIAYFGNTGKSLETPLRNEPAAVDKPQKTVPLERSARETAGKFILTAVARKNLRYAWKITGPHLREGQTLKQWLKGDIAVVPYPAKAIDVGLMKIDYSYQDEALLEVALIPKKGYTIKPQIFLIGLNAVGKGKKRHWVVDYWGPRATPETIPN